MNRGNWRLDHHDNEATATVTNGWSYDEAGNWLNAATGSQWVYNADNEMAAWQGSNHSLDLFLVGLKFWVNATQAVKV